jgi:glycosyltransferase involved in cell wall biosynthesis
MKFLNTEFGINKISLVPNWVEVNHSSAKRSTDRILMVGRLEYQKNYQMAIDFMIKLKKEVTIDIYGAGSLKEDLNNTALEKNLNINFLGSINHEELILIYQQYNYFLSTSEFEGNPKTILEALANGCVVFAKNNDNNAEIVRHGENGYLFSSTSELVGMFKNEFRNKDLLLKNDNYEYLKNNNIDVICKKMYEDYKDLMEFK